MSQSARTFLIVTAGVVAGGAILVGLGSLIGVVAVGGEGAEDKGGIEASPKKADETIDRSIEEERRDPSLIGERWCDSRTGDRLVELGAFLLATESPARAVELQDAILDLSDDAPPGAFCAVAELDALVTHWNDYAANSKARKFKPRQQVRRIREFQREHKLDEPL